MRVNGLTAVRSTAANSRPTSPPARPPVRSEPVTLPSRTSRGRPPNRHTRSPAPAASRIPAVVAPVSPGRGAESNLGMRSPGASASTHRATSTVSHAANLHPRAWIPGAIGTRRRRSRATTSRTQTTNGTRSIAMVSSASQPRSTFPERKSAGSPPRSMVTARVELGDDVGRRGAGPAELRGLEVVQPEVVACGAGRERHSRDLARDHRALLLGRVRDRVSGELVEEARRAGRHAVEGREAVACGGVGGGRGAPGRVGTDDETELRPARRGNVIDHDRGHDPRPQAPRPGELGGALSPGCPAVGRDEHEAAIPRHVDERAGELDQHARPGGIAAARTVAVGDDGDDLRRAAGPVGDHVRHRDR